MYLNAVEIKKEAIATPEWLCQIIYVFIICVDFKGKIKK
jgi:hypothetical protein